MPLCHSEQNCSKSCWLNCTIYLVTKPVDFVFVWWSEYVNMKYWKLNVMILAIFGKKQLTGQLAKVNFVSNYTWTEMLCTVAHNAWIKTVSQKFCLIIWRQKLNTRIGLLRFSQHSLFVLSCIRYFEFDARVSQLRLHFAHTGSLACGNEMSTERNVQNLCFVPGNETSWE